MRQRVDALALIGGILMLIDPVWGGLLVLGFDLSWPNGLLMGISFVIGLPVYLLDRWIDKRVAISMIGLFLFRWIATCFGGPHPVFCAPWRNSVLLMIAFVLLQVSKLRRERSLGKT